jgi:hypothetical protein
MEVFHRYIPWNLSTSRFPIECLSKTKTQCSKLCQYRRASNNLKHFIDKELPAIVTHTGRRQPIYDNAKTSITPKRGQTFQQCSTTPSLLFAGRFYANEASTNIHAFFALVQRPSWASLIILY